MDKGKMEGLVVMNILKKSNREMVQCKLEAKTNLGIRAEITPSDIPEAWKALAVVQSKSMKKLYLF